MSASADGASDKLEEAAQAIRDQTGVEVLAIALDMSESEAPAQFVEQVAAHFGKLDIVVANAGGPPSGPFVAMTDDQWALAVEQNLMSTIRMFRAGLPHVKQSDQGRLVAITSVSAKQPLVNLVLSNATRAGVHGMIKTLSREIASTGVTVNAVCPGTTRTDRITQLAGQDAEREGITLDEAYANWAVDRSHGTPGRSNGVRRCGHLSVRQAGGLHHRHRPARRWRILGRPALADDQSVVSSAR